jgi:ketosteroid isomerase-like protein
MPTSWAAAKDNSICYEVFTELTRQRIDAAYHCKTCDVEGHDEEVNGAVVCWFCGQPPSVTARIVKS